MKIHSFSTITYCPVKRNIAFFADVKRPKSFVTLYGQQSSAVEVCLIHKALAKGALRLKLDCQPHILSLRWCSWLIFK